MKKLLLNYFLFFGLILTSVAAWAQTAPNITYPTANSIVYTVNNTVSTAPANNAGGGTVPALVGGYGQVTLYAGSGTGTTGTTNGTSLTTARFTNPNSIVSDGTNLYIVDASNNNVRKIVISTGVVSVLAGAAGGAAGLTNGTGTAARFSNPRGIAIDASGTNLYVGDASNSVIRKIVISTGVVSTFATGFTAPRGLIIDPTGTYLYVADFSTNLIKRVLIATPTTIITVAGSGTASYLNSATPTSAAFNTPSDVACDASGNIYVTDYGNNVIRKISVASLATPTPGAVTTFAGPAPTTGAAAAAGSAAGSGNGAGAATFNLPRGITLDGAGNFYVGDYGSGIIRKITPAGVVTTLAGTGTVGQTNGAFSVATFSGPSHAYIDPQGNMYMPDWDLANIRLLTLSGYTIGPTTMPAGLTFNPATGVISGTPTTVAAAAPYTVTAYNYYGSFVCPITITINPVAPSALTYSAANYNFTVGSPNSTPAPTNSGGTPTTYAFDPSTPAPGWLTISSTGVISGNPPVAAVQVIYKINASNAGGTTQTSVGITCIASTPPIVAYSPASYTFVAGTGGTTAAIGNTGGAATYSIDASTPFPPYLSVNSSTGVITCTAAAVTTAAVTYKIDAVNSSGSAIANITITINPAAPVITYTPAAYTFTVGVTGSTSAPGNTGGAVASFAMDPTTPLPGYLSLNTSTGVITSSTASVSAAATAYKVIATNATSTSTATVTITELAVPNLAYNTPNTYTVGSAIPTLAPTNTGGAVTTGILFNTTGTTVLNNAANGLVNPYGMAVDPAGNVYVANFGGNSIVEYSTTGTVTPFSTGAGTGPVGLAFDASGNAYVLNQTTKTLVKYAGGLGGTATTIVTGTTVATAIAIDNAGNLYVANMAGTNTISKYNTSGVGGIVVTSNTTYPISAGITVDSNGNIYASDNVGSYIDIYNQAGTRTSSNNLGNTNSALYADGAGNIFLTTTGGQYVRVYAPNLASTIQTITPPFASPRGVVADKAGNMYVSDYNANTVTKYVPISGYYLSGQLPTGLAFNNTNGNITGTPTAAFSGSFTVTAYNAAGAGTSNTFTITCGSKPVLSYPSPDNYAVSGTAITPLSPTNTGSAVTSIYTVSPGLPTGFSINSTTGVISGTPSTATASATYTVTASNSYGTGTFGVVISIVAPPAFTYTTPNNYIVGTAIASLNPTPTASGGTVAALTYGTGSVYSPTNLSTPYGMAFDASGNLFVVDNASGKITEYASGSTTGTVVITGLTSPSSIAIDPGGNIFIGTTGGSVLKYSSGFVLQTYTLGNTPLSVYGITTDASGNVYVADQSGGYIYKYSPTGASLLTISYTGTGSGYIFDPTGVQVDAAGNIYTIDSYTNLLAKFSSTGAYIATIATGLNGAYGFYMDGSGNFYVANTGSGKVNVYNSAGILQTTVTPTLGTTPRGVIADKAGNIYIDDYSTGNYLYKYAPLGNYYLNGTLPAGLSFNSVTGAITGTPTVAFSGSFTVTAYNIAGPGISNSFIINCFPPPTIVYNPSTVSWGVGVAVTLTPTLTGSPTSITVSPGLPAGLSLDPVTGVISGTPTAATAMATYTFTATNAYGTGTAKEVITVSQPPSAITYTPSTNVYTAGVAIPPLTPVVTGGQVPAKTVLSGATFNNPYGMGIDGAGNVYIANSGNGAVNEFGPTGTLIRTIASGITNPTGVVFDAAGNAYISALNGYIYKYSTANVRTTISTFAASAYAIAIDAAGNLYFDDYTNGTLDKYTASTATTSVLVAAGSTGINYPTGVAVDGAGNVYVADRYYKSITKYNSNGTYVSTVIANLSYPYGFTMDAAGNFYVGDSGSRTVTIYNSAGAVINTIANVSDPRGVTVDAQGDIYVSDYTANTVTKYAPFGGFALSGGTLPQGLSFDTNTGTFSGTPTVLFGPTTYTVTAYNAGGNASTTVTLSDAAVAPVIAYNPSTSSFPVNVAITPLNVTESGGPETSVGFGPATTFATLPTPATNAPYGEAIDASGNIYVVSQGGQSLTKYSSTGAVLLTLPLGYKPNGVAVDGSGNIYVIRNNGNVYKYNSSGTGGLYLSGYGNSGATGSGLGIAVDQGGNLYMTDNNGGRVVRYSVIAGTYVTLISSASPSGVTVDNSGNVYVLDISTKTLKKYSSTGVLTSNLVSGLNSPYGVFMDTNANLYVTGSTAAGAVTEYSSTGAVINSVTSGVTTPRGVVVDSQGSMYVSDNTAGTIVKYPALFYSIGPAGLPPGITFNNVTGQFAGTPTAAFGPVTYTITANGYGGTSATATETITCYLDYDWVGTTSSDWNVGSNWLSGSVPVATSAVNIGVSKAFTNQPVFALTAPFTSTVAAINIGNSGGKAVNLGVASGSSLTVTGDITKQSDANSTLNYVTQLSGLGTLKAANVNVISNTLTATAAYTENINTSVTSFSVTNNINLTSNFSTYAFNASFNVTGGSTSLPGTFVSTNTAGSTSTISVAGGTLKMSNATPLSSLSSTGTNVVNFNGVGGVVEYSGANQTIYTDAVLPNVSNTISYTGLTLSGTGAKTPNAGNLNVGGSFTNSLTNDASNYVTLTGTPVFFNGTVAQTLAGGAGTGTIFNNVSFSGASTKTMASGSFSVISSGLLTMSGSSTSTILNAGGFLTLISDVNGSATVPAFTGPSITGNVTVQRYITGGAGYRGYRLVSSPVYISNAGGNNVISVGYPILNVYLKGTTGSAGGFDDGGNPNLYLFRENLVPSNTSFTSGNFRGVNNISTPGSYNFDGETGAFNIPVGNGFMMFYRGSRKADIKANEYVTTYVPQADTLNATGILNQGPITVKDWFTPSSGNLSFTGISGDPTVNGFNLVGNPYASSIDWDNYSTSAGSPITAPGVGPFLYVLDSKSSNYNVYQAGSASKAGTIAPTGSNIIPSGQGFFVVAGSTSAAITFNEAAKTNAQATAAIGNLFMGTPPVANTGQYMRLMLAKDSIHVDGIVINFNSTAKPGYVFGEDAPYKLGNGPVSLASTSADNIGLAINTLPLPTGTQVIKLQVGAATDGVYTLALKEVASVPAIYDVWLKDAYRKDSLDIKHNPTYAFDVLKSDTASFGANRFSLIIRQNPLLGLHLLSFAGEKITTGTQVVWTTENEQNYTNFTVERSIDNGTSFQVVGGFASTGAGTYSFIDKAPVTTVNDQYRLKLVDLNGNVTYSSIVIIQYAPSSNNIARNGMTIYPNPAIGTINVSINQTIPNPSYQIQVVNNLGTVVKTATSTNTAWQDDVSRLVPGTYIIKVINNANKTEVGKGTFVKL